MTTAAAGAYQGILEVGGGGEGDEVYKKNIKSMENTYKCG